MENAIEIKNLSVYYDHTCALSKVNLVVKQKDFLGIMGPNGGGKSTLLKVMLGLVPTTDGSVAIMGQPIHQAHAPIGYVPQFSKFDKRFPISVMDVVLMGRLSRKSGFFHRFKHEDREIVKSMLERMNIYDLKDRQISQLSGGQLQRVLIARALAIQPGIMLLDEPTASVDANSKLQIYEILKQLNQEMTIIIVTHDTGVVSSHIKNIACLNRELYYHGEPELSNETMHQMYGCPVDLIAHGVPHRVLKEH